MILAFLAHAPALGAVSTDGLTQAKEPGNRGEKLLHAADIPFPPIHINGAVTIWPTNHE